MHLLWHNIGKSRTGFLSAPLCLQFINDIQPKLFSGKLLYESAQSDRRVWFWYPEVGFNLKGYFKAALAPLQHVSLHGNKFCSRRGAKECWIKDERERVRVWNLRFHLWWGARASGEFSDIWGSCCRERPKEGRNEGRKKRTIARNFVWFAAKWDSAVGGGTAKKAARAKFPQPFAKYRNTCSTYARVAASGYSGHWKGQTLSF